MATSETLVARSRYAGGMDNNYCEICDTEFPSDVVIYSNEDVSFCGRYGWGDED